MAKREYNLPVVVEVLDDRGGTCFHPADKVLADPKLRGQAVKKALAEVGPWLDLWGDFFACLADEGKAMDRPLAHGIEIAQTIGRARKDLGAAWPTLPADRS
jgi:hypothetical protein